MRSGNQSAAGAIDPTKEDFGYQMLCWFDPGEYLVEGTLTKPAGSSVPVEGLFEGDGYVYARNTYSSSTLAVLEADIVPGQYSVYALLADGRANRTLRFKFTVESYTAASLPGYVVVESPAWGGTGISRTPLFDFDVADWDFLQLYDNVGNFLYEHNRDGGDVPADRHQLPLADALAANSWCWLTVTKVVTTGDVWFESSTWVQFRTGSL
ncbi:MAG: hypothetical protein BWZ02_01722 [Lentisphaerae bacterium ADurb.BinA184]|nr:MAG: hypothetical protein BWZ02_01722 [Lentisphaerae bacterium ADurb.BinA184]